CAAVVPLDAKDITDMRSEVGSREKVETSARPCGGSPLTTRRRIKSLSPDNTDGAKRDDLRQESTACGIGSVLHEIASQRFSWRQASATEPPSHLNAMNPSAGKYPIRFVHLNCNQPLSQARRFVALGSGASVLFCLFALPSSKKTFRRGFYRFRRNLTISVVSASTAVAAPCRFSVDRRRVDRCPVHARLFLSR